MAVCEACNRDMLETGTCDPIPVKIDGKLWKPIAYVAPEEITPVWRCHDCNVMPGGLHHPGCDMERCPKCKGQLISCGCLDEDEVKEESDEQSVAGQS